MEISETFLTSKRKGKQMFSMISCGCGILKVWKFSNLSVQIRRNLRISPGFLQKSMGVLWIFTKNLEIPGKPRFVLKSPGIPWTFTRILQNSPINHWEFLISTEFYFDFGDLGIFKHSLVTFVNRKFSNEFPGISIFSGIYYSLRSIQTKPNWNMG